MVCFLNCETLNASISGDIEGINDVHDGSDPDNSAQKKPIVVDPPVVSVEDSEATSNDISLQQHLDLLVSPHTEVDNAVDNVEAVYDEGKGTHIVH
jgi:hypothetical protein